MNIEHHSFQSCSSARTRMFSNVSDFWLVAYTKYARLARVRQTHIDFIHASNRFSFEANSNICGWISNKYGLQSALKAWEIPQINESTANISCGNLLWRIYGFGSNPFTDGFISISRFWQLPRGSGAREFNRFQREESVSVRWPVIFCGDGQSPLPPLATRENLFELHASIWMIYVDGYGWNWTKYQCTWMYVMDFSILRHWMFDSTYHLSANLNVFTGIDAFWHCIFQGWAFRVTITAKRFVKSTGTFMVWWYELYRMVWSIWLHLLDFVYFTLFVFAAHWMSRLTQNKYP